MSSFLDSMKGWRTLAFNLTSAAGLIVQNASFMNLFSQAHQIEILSIEAGVVAVVNIVLRFATTTPVMQSKPPVPTNPPLVRPGS